MLTRMLGTMDNGTGPHPDRSELLRKRSASSNFESFPPFWLHPRFHPRFTPPPFHRVSELGHNGEPSPCGCRSWSKVESRPSQRLPDQVEVNDVRMD